MIVFYEPNAENGRITLSKDESKHCLQVLRKSIGDIIYLVDGKGKRFESKIIDQQKGLCIVETLNEYQFDQKDFFLHLAIAPTKNTDRMEWMIEKLTEIGVDKITFLLTKNSERKNLRLDRLEKKVISALKQSKGGFLTQINGLINFDTFLEQENQSQKFIAHLNGITSPLHNVAIAGQNTCLLIGPEGDFHPEEIEYATNKGFRPISLGQNVYRTETAGFVACCQINFINGF